MASVLVTGASGVIGTGLCKHLESMPHDVLGIDNDDPEFDHDISVENHDLHSDSDLPKVDVIVHLAAHSRVPPILDEPSLAFENITAIEPVLEHARRTDAHVVFASSREVYGNAINAEEDDISTDQPNPYGASKLAGEALVNAYNNSYDVSTTVLRLSNVYGPYDTNSRVVPIFIALADAGERLSVYGGNKLLDFVHIETVTEVIADIINRPEAFNSEIVNVGSGRGIPLTSLAGCIADEIEACPGYEITDSGGNETSRFVADVDKMKSLFDVTPSSIPEKLPEVIAWYRERPNVLQDIRAKE